MLLPDGLLKLGNLPRAHILNHNRRFSWKNVALAEGFEPLPCRKQRQGADSSVQESVGGEWGLFGLQRAVYLLGMVAKQSLEGRVPGGLAGEGASECCGLVASAEDAPSGFALQAVAAPSLSQRGVRCLAMSAVVVSQLFLP